MEFLALICCERSRADKGSCDYSLQNNFEFRPDSFILTAHPSSECDGLHKDWKHVITDKFFPAIEGEVITVNCKEGYINLGAGDITCISGTTYETEAVPSCQKAGMYRKTSVRW